MATKTSMEQAPEEGNEATPDSAPEAKEEGEKEVDEPEEEIKLYKSSRLKGYLTLTLASSINLNSALQSKEAIQPTAVAASEKQRRYSMAVSIVTLILCVIIIFAHLDRYTPLKKYWYQAFGPKDKIELYLVVFVCVWWLVATSIQTGIRGIAGDGKGQYNLYFSTWACFWASVWTFERWLVSRGRSSFQGFMASWPHRAPGWIAIFFFSFGDLMCILDLFLNWDAAYPSDDDPQRTQFDAISRRQWEWLLFTTAFTIPFAVGFVLVELFRETAIGKTSPKSGWETILEGVVLCLLVLTWIPSVIVATTPGGVASLVGNAYFFTWLGTTFVIETAVWWIHDWRKSIQSMLEQQEEDYRKIQKEVLEASLAVERDEQIPEEDQIIDEGNPEVESGDYSDYDENSVIPDVLGA